MMEQIKKIPFNELYQHEGQINGGTFGVVVQAVNKTTGRKVAIKQIYVQQNQIQDYAKQINNMKIFNSNHIISFLDQFYDKKSLKLCIVMPKAMGGNLRDMMKKKLNAQQIKSFLIQVFSGFYILDSKGVMHLDLKPQNILVFNNQKTIFCLCDFGCSQITQFSRLSGYQNVVHGTPNYLGPEQYINFRGQRSRNSADIWALGIILYQLITGKLPFQIDSQRIVQRDDMLRFFQGKKQIDFSCQQEYKDLMQIVKLMLKANPMDRIRWLRLKSYLIQKMGVEQHQFLNVEIVLNNLTNFLILSIKNLKILKKNLQQSSAFPFNKHKQQISEYYEILIKYTIVLCLRFNQTLKYKLKQFAKFSQINVYNSLFQEIYPFCENICRQREESIPTYKDYFLRQALLYKKLTILDSIFGKPTFETTNSALFCGKYVNIMLKLLNQKRNPLIDKAIFQQLQRIRI